MAACRNFEVAGEKKIKEYVVNVSDTTCAQRVSIKYGHRIRPKWKSLIRRKPSSP